MCPGSALANERVQCNAAAPIVLKLKSPWRDGTTHLVMSPLECMQRLAALLPRPRLHLIRFHGVLAPNAKLRAMVVPQGPVERAPAAKPAECEANWAHHRPGRRRGLLRVDRRCERPEHCQLHCRSSGPALWAAGTGCVRGFQDRGETA